MKMLRLIGRQNKGNAAVEFALTLPIFAILIFGIIEFGWFYFVQHTLQYATREGMRWPLLAELLPIQAGTRYRVKIRLCR